MTNHAMQLFAITLSSFALTFLLIVAIRIWRRRWQLRVPVIPDARTLDDPKNFNPPLRRFVDQLEPQLRDQGFQKIATLFVPRLGEDRTWSQLLFTHLESPVRVSIVCMRRGVFAELNLLVATQYADGSVLATAVNDLLQDQAAPMRPEEVDARDVLKLHDRRVAEFEAASTRTIDSRVRVPRQGEEFEWLRGRAGAVTQDFTRDLYILSRDGKWYLPRLRLVLRDVMSHLTARHARPPQGSFEVVLHKPTPNGPAQQFR